MNRVKVSLDAVGLKIKDFEFPDYDYQQQGEILHSIIDKYNEYSKYKNLLTRVNRQHLIDNKEVINEENTTKLFND